MVTVISLHLDLHCPTCGSFECLAPGLHFGLGTNIMGTDLLNLHQLLQALHLGSTKTEHQGLLLLTGGTLLIIYDVLQQLLTDSILLTPELLLFQQYFQGIHLGFYLCADFISCTEQPWGVMVSLSGCL